MPGGGGECGRRVGKLFLPPGGRYFVHAIRKPVEKWDCKVPPTLDDPNPW